MPFFNDRPNHRFQAGHGARSLAGVVAFGPDHPLVIFAWLVAGLLVAAGLGPWLSHTVGVVLPAFAFVRTSRGDAPVHHLEA